MKAFKTVITNAGVLSFLENPVLARTNVNDRCATDNAKNDQDVTSNAETDLSRECIRSGTLMVCVLADGGGGVLLKYVELGSSPGKRRSGWGRIFDNNNK